MPRSRKSGHGNRHSSEMRYRNEYGYSYSNRQSSTNNSTYRPSYHSIYHSIHHSTHHNHNKRMTCGTKNHSQIPISLGTFKWLITESVAMELGNEDLIELIT
jgi:hypothetical protein